MPVLPPLDIQAPQEWLSLTLLPYLFHTDFYALSLTSKTWSTVFSSETTFRHLCLNALPNEGPLACPPELCGGHATWKAMYKTLCGHLRTWEGRQGPSGPSTFTTRVTVRFRPSQDSFGEDAPPPPTPMVHVPIHQRMQMFRASHPHSRSEALKKLWGGGEGGENRDPWASAVVGGGGSTTTPCLPAPTPVLASPSILPTSPTELMCVAPRVGLRHFHFNSVLPALTSQEEVYAGVARGPVFTFLNGSNATIFAYGQTGSGKTHTMGGSEGQEGVVLKIPPPTLAAAQRASSPTAFKAAGIIPRALSDIMASLHARIAKGTLASFALTMCVVEVYGTEVSDLLGDGKPIGPWSAAAAAAVVAGAAAVPLFTAEQASTLLSRAETLKRRAATELNARSSRAHTLTILDLHQVGVGGGAGAAPPPTLHSKLTLCDLGGSENVMASGALYNKERLREAVHINCSLLALKKCIAARVAQCQPPPSTAEGGAAAAPTQDLLYPPYGDSRLTQLLAPSLSGEAAVVSVVIGARSEPRHIAQTLGSLRFGEDCGALKGVAGKEGAGGGSNASGMGSTGAAGVLEALTLRINELEGLIRKGERWDKGIPMGVEGLREEYEALLQTRRCVLG